MINREWARVDVCNLKRLRGRLSRRTHIECEHSAETYLCLIEVAIEFVWFELKENTTETKLRKMRCEM